MASPQKREQETDPLFHRVVEGITGHLADRIMAIPSEVYAGITDRIIPQGAAELSQAIFTGHAYAPYGPALRPLKLENPGHGVYGPEKTPEERAAEAVALEEAKAALKVGACYRQGRFRHDPGGATDRAAFPQRRNPEQS